MIFITHDQWKSLSSTFFLCTLGVSGGRKESFSLLITSRHVLSGKAKKKMLRCEENCLVKSVWTDSQHLPSAHQFSFSLKKSWLQPVFFFEILILYFSRVECSQGSCFRARPKDVDVIIIFLIALMTIIKELRISLIVLLASFLLLISPQPEIF